jgi:hypothetical protein
MKQEREEKEEKRRRKKEGSRRHWVSVGSRRKDLIVALRHFAADPPRSRPTSHRDPRLGLAGRGSGFFFFVIPSGLIFF